MVMNRTYGKLLGRGVKATRARFISILAIVTVGVGFLAGLLATTPDMQYTADKYYDDYALFDIDVRGALGMTGEDARALEALDSVERAMPAYVTDLNMEDANGAYVTRIYGVPLDEAGQDGFLNGFELTEGRMPQNPGECLIASPNGFLKHHRAGTTYTVSADNKDSDSLSDTYAFTELTAVGVVQTPYYMSMESEPSTVGTGSVGLVMYVYPECYRLEAYTDVFLTAAGAKELDAFSDEYAELIDEVSGELETFGLERSEIRYNEIRDEAGEKIDEAEAEYADAKNEAERELSDARAELDDGWAKLADAKAELEEKKQELADAKDKLLYAEIDARNQADSARAQLEPMRPYMPEEQYAAAMAQIDATEQSGLSQIYARYDDIYEAEDAIAEAEGEIADSEKELEDGETDYAEARDEAETELADAEEKIGDARGELDELEKPEWYVTDRRDTVSYSSYKANSNKIDAIARVFPLFFFLVAALVALTTMTRMVEEERGQIGTLKALGYSNGKIAAYYVGYSVLASLAGSAIGCVIGFKLLPLVISNAYGMMYTLPRVELTFRWSYAFMITPIAVGCTTLATLAACVSELREKPALLMQPKAPKAGKRILLERVGFVWKRMSFIKKVTARNIFRYKKRLFMTVFGIAGCTALLVTGFGLRDSIHAIVEKQFGEIYKYNLALYVSDGEAAENDEAIASFLESEYVSGHALMHSESGHVDFGGGSEKVNIYVPKVTQQLKEQFTLRERKSGADVPFDEDSLVLTEKLCEKLGVRVGDAVTVRNLDGREAELSVTGITENYVAGYAFMSAGAYRAAFGAEPEYKLILTDVTDESGKARDEISQEVLKSGEVLLVQFSQTIRESFENTVKSIDYIVMVLIISAGLLAVVVLYNLTNINISERKKELATIKVLGFHEREVASYIYRETSVLCLIGIAFGFGFGTWLHAYVVRTAEVDAVMFGRSVNWQSYLFAALATLFFTVVVDLIMLKKLRGIDMVESMKAGE